MELQKDMILLNQEFTNKEDAIREAGRLLVEAGCVDEAYVDAMIDRNNIVSTYMGNFIAIPHGTEDAKKFVKKSGISIIQIPQGVNFSNEGEEEEKLTMVVFGIAGVENEHLDILQKIAIFCSDVENVVKVVGAGSAEEIIALFEEAE